MGDVAHNSDGTFQIQSVAQPALSLVEFDVNLTCEGCASSVRKALSMKSGIQSVVIDVKKQSVLIESTVPSQELKETIEETGKQAVLKGIGSKNVNSAVAELNSRTGIMGVIRFHQLNGDTCVIDGTVDGLASGDHGLHIHEFGDLSEGCESIGPHYNPDGSAHGDRSNQMRHYGDLGNISADSLGRASFRFQDRVVKVHDIIGRSVAVTSRHDDGGSSEHPSSAVDGNSGKCLAAAIIARSAGLFDNPKRLCQCDGVSVWDEVKPPASSL